MKESKLYLPKEAGRVVVVGGFGSGKKQVEYLTDAAREHFKQHLGLDGADVKGITLADATDDFERTRDEIDGTHIVTHSAGIVAVNEAAKLGGEPESVSAFAPPSPKGLGGLIARAGMKPFLEAWASPEDAVEVLGLNVQVGKNILRHPYKNLRNLGRIACYDIDNEVANLLRPRTDGDQGDYFIHFGHMSQDGFGFKYPPVQSGEYQSVILEGIHDKLLIKPQEVLEEFRQKTQQ